MGKKKIKPQPSPESTDEEQITLSQQHHQEHEEDQAPSEDEDQASSSDTESDSGSEPHPPPPSPPKSKSKTKFIDQTPKPDSDPHASKKRPTNNTERVMNDSKRGKKKATVIAISAVADENEDVEAKSGGDPKKLFQRLWSDEDEIAILEGMVKFTSQTGSDPFKNADAFYDFVKESLHVEASISQLKDKIRRLKKKFETNAHKASLSKPHDQRAFELSKKVWGNAAGGGGGGVENEEPVKNNPTKEGRAMEVAPPKPKLQHELRSVDAKKDVKMILDEKDDTTSRLMELMRLDKVFGLYGLNEDVVKRGMELIGASERGELEEEWKELQHAELELHVKRAELIAKQARMILEAFNSSDH